MHAVEFRLRDGVVEYRTLIIGESTVTNEDGDDCDGPLQQYGYTDWMPLPEPPPPRFR
jgi:hypothetical protein